jgi:hypothetical protein
MMDYDNHYTGSQSVISIWQISKVIPPDILPSVRIESLLGNIAEMIDKGLLKELGDPCWHDTISQRNPPYGTDVNR